MKNVDPTGSFRNQPQPVFRQRTGLFVVSQVRPATGISAHLNTGSTTTTTTKHKRHPPQQKTWQASHETNKVVKVFRRRNP